jgi:hypothetical protein
MGTSVSPCELVRALVGRLPAVAFDLVHHGPPAAEGLAHGIFLLYYCSVVQVV